MIEIVLMLIGVLIISGAVGLIIGIGHGLVGAYRTYRWEKWRRAEEEWKNKRPRR